MQENLQQKVHQQLSKHFIGVTSTNDSIRILVSKLNDKDLEALKEVEGMYRELSINRSGSGISVNLNF